VGHQQRARLVVWSGRPGVGKASLEGKMVGLGKSPDIGVHDGLIRKFRSLGLDHEEALRTFLSIVKVRGHASRGEDIVGPSSSSKHLTVLLAGIACLYKRIEDGSRQIYAFQYPGDFCDLHRYVLPKPDEGRVVGALVGCSIGIIQHKELDRTIEQYPKLGLVLWRASMLEASIFAERLLNLGRRAALQRVAHLLCEQLARREMIGITSAVIPLAQTDLADAAGLSTVHINRVLQDLRRLGVLSEMGRTIEVLSTERLVDIAKFDGRYLNMPVALLGWKIHAA
jgi:CRP-like cAMP-binding protein